MASLLIPIPLTGEQTEIVRLLDNLLAKEQQAKEVRRGGQEQVVLIKKAILALAFRGELDINNSREKKSGAFQRTIM